MKYNVFFTIVGPTGVSEAANKTNPVKANNLQELLALMSQNFPTVNADLGLRLAGVRVEEADEVPEAEEATGEMPKKESDEVP